MRAGAEAQALAIGKKLFERLGAHRAAAHGASASPCRSRQASQVSR
jgi:hypothetical protein